MSTLKKTTVDEKKAALKTRKKVESVSLKTTPEKKMKSARTPKKTTTKTATKKERATNSANAVRLPSNMSQRAIEKSQVLMNELEQAMFRIAYVSGLCFILVGAAYATFSLNNQSLALKAELIAVTDSSYETISEPTSTTNTDDPIVSDTTVVNQEEQLVVPTEIAAESETLVLKSEFRFLNSVPSNVTEPVEVYFEVTNALEVKSNLVIVGKTGFITLLAEKLSSQKYRVSIPVTSLSPNYYELRIYVKPADGSTVYVRRTNQFFVGSEDVEKWFNSLNDEKVTVSDSATEPDTTTTESSADDTEENTTDTTPVVQEPEPVPVSEPVADSALNFSISSRATVLTEAAVLNLVTPTTLNYVELYARPVNALNARFVTLATKRFEQWAFVFDSKNLPNGDYEFFAQTKIDGVKHTSKSIKLTVKNALSATSLPVVQPSTEERTPITLNTEPFVPETTFDERVSEETSALIKENEQDLATLLTNYAAAKQAGDESLVRVATEAIETRRESIALSVHQNDRIRDISDTVADELLVRINDIQARIDTFEELRKQRSQGETAVDTDQDGISDIDETTLYNTDPRQADTDNDGITDGVEIMRGFNPNDATPEAIVRFESPKETLGLTRDDALTITTVVPLIADTTEQQNPTVATEITGTALPNSFVTLYIFSTPTIVTVRTDANGMFVFTFDKELDDGRHDVYVAITDNAGAIIAQSNPFSFVKEAQAFTPVAAADAVAVTPPPITEVDRGGYDLAIAVSILGFGLLLLMLGLGLRRKNTSEIIITEFSDDEMSDQQKDLA
jgi:hypothetical protein